MSTQGSSWNDEKTTTSTPIARSSSDITRAEEGKINEDQPSLGTYQYSFFSPEVAPLRKAYFKIIITVLVLTIIVMWSCLPLYWASLASSSQHAKNLSAWLIDRDGSDIGQAVTGVALSSNEGSEPHLGWVQVPADDFPTDHNVIQAILSQKIWVAVVINTNATSKLLTAQQTGNASYTPSHAISVYYEQGRNEIAAANLIVPIITGVLQAATQAVSANLTAQYLASVVGDGDAISKLVGAPQTVSNSVGWETFNLRPYTASVATAVTLVGQIYLCIFSFILTMANDAARNLISKHLTMRSYIKLRILIPLIAYIPLSLSYAMISLPFHLPFGAKWTYAGGFFVFWLFVYMGMTALGLATEAMITLLTPKFMAFFLLPLIISNVSVASLPNELQPGIFKYGVGFPVYNLGQAIRTIIFNTKNRLALNAGVLLAWIALSLCTVTVFTWVMRRREMRRN